MKILIAPCNETHPPKRYPYWKELEELLKDHEVKKVEGIQKNEDLIELVNWCDVWITIDSFLPHFCKYYQLKKGIVLWGKSDPEIFGYPENINLLKDRKYLRKEQFRWWRDEKIDTKIWVTPEEIKRSLDKIKQ